MILEKQASFLAVVAVMAVSLGVAPGSAAEAREHGAHGQRPAAQHAPRVRRGDYARHTERQRTDSGYTRRDTWQGENGRTASRTATVANDREAGARTGEVEWVGPDGKTASRSDVATRTNSGYTRDSAFTGPNGQTATRSASVVNDREAGTRSREAVTTLPDGRTRGMTDVATRTDDGSTRETSVTHPNGSTMQRDVRASYDPETRTWSRDISVDRQPPPGE